jgi:hypothetical protein
MVERVERARNYETAVDRGITEATVSGPTLLARVVWWVAGILLILLAFRFVLALLGANPANGFANFIYDTSHPFVSPFFGLFNYSVVDNGVGRFELYTLVAMAVYAVLAWGLASLFTIGRNRGEVV